MLLVLCSNRGLCGGYNAGILREADAAHPRRPRPRASTLHLEAVRQAGDHLLPLPAASRPSTPTRTSRTSRRFDEVEELADRYIADYIAGKIDRVEVAYMKFLNAARQTPVVETLLPLSTVPAPAQAAEPAPKRSSTSSCPTPTTSCEEILPVSFKVRLFKCFLDAAVSEQIARRVAMKAATENADDMIKALTQQYNRARQAKITKEIVGDHRRRRGIEIRSISCSVSDAAKRICRRR